MEIEKTMEESSRVKIETPDDQEEDFENNFEYTDELQVGQEFKTEPLAIERNLSSNVLPSARPSDLKNLVIYCNHCNKTLKLSEKKAKKCNTCKSSGKFKCGKCMKIYSFMHLNRHLKKHSNQEPQFYCCDHCKYKSNQKRHLANHVQAKHLPRDTDLYKCDKCEKNFLSKVGFNQHSKICGRTNDSKRSLASFSCSHCEYKTLYKSNLNRHTSEKHLRGDSIFKCDKCAKVYLNPVGFKAHLKLCGQTNEVKRSLMSYSCDLCEVKTFTKIKILEHIQAKHLPRDLNLIECKKCGKRYTSQASLKSHARKYCKKSENLKRSSSIRYSCHHCSYNTHRKEYLAGHIQAKHLPRHSDFNKCDKCGKNFAFRKTLRAHSKVCGQSKDSLLAVMSFSCDHCSYKSPHKRYLLDHLRRKHSTNCKIFKCTKCKKWFSSKKNLNTHKYYCKVVPSSKKFCCDHCDYKCKDKIYLKNHIQMKHLNEVFECSACGKSFGSQHNQSKHSRLRCKKINMKTFKCVACGKTFGDKSVMRQHAMKDCKKLKECFVSLVRI